MSLNEQEISRETIFTGRVIDLVMEQVELPNGKKASREVVLHPGAVCCLAINQDNKILLVKQWREPLKKISIEIPAGKLDKADDSQLDAMKRELDEETGYKAEYWAKIIAFNSSPGFSNEELTLFYCDSLTELSDKSSMADDEFVEKMWVSLPETKEMIANGEIVDLKTIYAVSYWENMQLRSTLNEQE